MKHATIELLNEDEWVLGSKTRGQYMVREYENDVEIGGMFFESLADAQEHVENYCYELNDWFFKFFLGYDYGSKLSRKEMSSRSA